MGARTTVAVIVVGLTITTLRYAAPAPASRIVVPDVKLLPDSVTFTDVPVAPVFGDTLVSIGADPPAVTWNATLLLVPPAVVTVTLCVPRALLWRLWKERSLSDWSRVLLLRPP